MKSVGEVMSIGSNFQESLQKALCSMEEGLNGLNSANDKVESIPDEEILNELTIPGPKRLFYVADAIRKKWSLEKIHKLTMIDYWFLDQIAELLEMEKKLLDSNLDNLDKKSFLLLKEKGFSDCRIAYLTNHNEDLSLIHI